MINFLRAIVFALSVFAASFIPAIKQSYPAVHYVMGGSVGKHEVTLGIFAVKNGAPTLLLTQCFKTKEITDFVQFLEPILRGLKEEQTIEIKEACFGVPGNTSADRMVIQAPHLDFPVDGHALVAGGLLKKVYVINDFEVQGLGVECLDAESVIQINSCAERPHAPKMIVGAGAGLGSALLVWQEDAQNYSCLPFGACFMDFMAHTPAELAYGQFIKERLKQQKLSWGNILGSTGGIQAAYEYLATQKSYADQVAITDAQSIFANRVNDAHCKDAVDLYMQLYARLVRNMAYAALPYGGLYITNAIAQENSELFTAPEFMQEVAKCNHEWLLKNIIEEIPLYIVTDPNIGLYGAAQYVLTH